MKDMVAMANGTILVNVHTAEECAGQWCCIHKPSRHHMADWPHEWANSNKTMWRICPHQDYHPDPDDLAFLRHRYDADHVTDLIIHACDGCCQPNMAPPPAPRKELNR